MRKLLRAYENKIHPVSVILAFLLGVIPVADANIYKSRIDPHWDPDGEWMWYRNDLAKGEREFILVDLKKGLHPHLPRPVKLQEIRAGKAIS
ncbi:MAG: hypothetical protein OSB65_16870 [Roseibacillus sp.]|nr:hypothetical protein [Roseibacillus sp.]